MSTCGKCNGAGQVVDVQQDEDGNVRITTVLCPACGGSGRV